MNKRDTIRLLKRARSRIQKGWCQGTEARDYRGWRVSPQAPEAESWCMLGALHADYNLDSDTYWDARHILADSLPKGARYRTPAHFNDKTGRTADQVVVVFDKAIQGLEAK